MGRYVPPEHEGLVSANKLAGKHALGARARKSGQGILTVRFEMPFSVWCNHCPKPTIIGQGVRFNAEKKKVGNYYSTPIFSFRMKHSVCDGWIEIRTDPKNTAYIVTEGGKKKDSGEDKVLDGEIRLGMTDEDRARLENDAFAALESKVDDRKQASSDKKRIETLYGAKQRDWEDPGEANRRLRRGFRAERKIRQRREGATEALKDKLSLGIELVDENDEDRQRAELVEFGLNDADDNDSLQLTNVRLRPLFNDSNGTASPSRGPAQLSQKREKKKGRARSDIEIRKEKLRMEVGSNTRTALDPFLGNSGTTTRGAPLTVFRKEVPSRTSEKEQETESSRSATTAATNTGALVDYDSD